MKTKFTEVIVPPNNNRNWMGGAYTLAFVYSNKGNFLVKGYLDEVRDYVKKNYKKYFVNYSLWSDGQHRDIWDFWKDSIGIHKPSRFFKTNKWEFRTYSCSYNPDRNIKKLYFKRLPKCWVKELEQF